MAVDQARRERRALGIDDEIGIFRVEILFPTDRADSPIDRNDRVGIEHGMGKIARKQRRNIAQDELAPHRAAGHLDRHDPLLVFLTLKMMAGGESRGKA